jgi:hypothetical protein
MPFKFTGTLNKLVINLGANELGVGRDYTKLLLAG